MPSMIAAYRCLMQLCLLNAIVLGSPLGWAQETDQESPVGAVGGAVHADLFTGTATTSIPIEVPPGRGGIQPDLALIYGSSNGNSWVGQGWKLEKGVIERQTKFGVNYLGDDYVFRLSGINVELVHIGGGEYRAKVEGGFNRILKKVSSSDSRPYFEVTDKTGTKFVFGSVPGTRVAEPNSSSHIFRWCLERVEDVHGNYMTLSYTPDQGQAYLSQIDYTGNVNGGLPTTHQVKFHLEDRPDALPMYVPNFPMKTAKRLKTIEVRGNGSLVRAYALNYIVSANTSHSLLKDVQQFGKDVGIDGEGTVTGVSLLPKIDIQFAGGGIGFTNNIIGPAWSDGAGWGESQYYSTIQYPDLNGDGKTDICARAAAGITCHIGTGSGFLPPFAGPAWTDGAGWGQIQYYSTIQYPDLNGDGKADICGRTGAGIVCHIGTGSGFLPPFAGPAWTDGAGWGESQYYSTIQYPDLNGDGKTDICARAAAGITCHIGTGSGFLPPFAGPAWTDGAGWGQIQYYSTIRYPDLNGDGKADICSRGVGGITCRIGTGSGFSSAQLGGPPWTDGAGWDQIQYYSTIQYHDLNGDGKADVCIRGVGGIRCRFGTGSDGFSTVPFIGPAWTDGANWNQSQYYSTIRYPDLNGDGKADICARAAGGITCHIGTGSSFSSAPFAGPAWADGANWNQSQYYSTIQYPDLNGDGKADICGRTGAGIICEVGNTNGLEKLRTISNALGGSTTIEYKPSTEYDNTQLPFPVQTVSKITSNDGNGHVAATTYDYSGGFYHIGQREFRGFHYVKMTGQAGVHGEQTITETRFHQGNYTVANENNPYAEQGYLKGKPRGVDVRDENGQLYSSTYTSYTADDNEQAPFFTPPLSVSHDIHDGTFKRARTDFDYDSYGNIILEKQFGDMSQPADDRIVLRTFSPNTTAWILSLPTYEGIFDGIAQGSEVAATNFYYDGTGNCSNQSGRTTPTKGNLTRVVKSLEGGTSPETGMTYDAYGNLTCIRDARGNMTTLTYDASHIFVTTSTNALGHQTSTTYYGVNGVAMDTGLYGQVKSVTDANGSTTTSEYDVFGRGTKVTQPNGLWATTTYNNFGTVSTQHVRTDSQAGLSTWTYFDGLGRTTKTRSTSTDGKITVAEVRYDNRGAVTQRSLPYFENGGTPQWTKFEYDPLGRVTKTINPDDSRVLACYDDWVTVSIDANNHRHRSVQDAYGRVLTVQEYLGTHFTCDTNVGSPYSTTTYGYDVLGNLETLIDAKGNSSTMTYDTLSRKTAMHDSDMGDWTYTYDAAGNLTQQTDAKEQIISFQYDALNRRVQKDYGAPQALGQGNVNYIYDGNTHFRKGRLQKVQDSSGTTTFYYDNMGQVIRTDKTVSGTTYTIQTTYDTLGRVVNLTYPQNSGTVIHSYNGPQLKEIKEGSTTYASYGGFNAQGQPSILTLGNGVTSTYTYDPNNYRLKTLKTVKGSLILQDLTYTFDTGGNILTLNDPVQGNQTFTYDGLERLTTATSPAGTLTYSYDQIGNMLSNSQVGSYTYPTSGSSSVQPHAVTTAGTNSYIYDPNGNMTSGAGRTITYDYEDRPISITQNGTTTTMLYDGDGGRVKKTVADGNMTTATTYIGKLYVCDGTSAPLSCAKMIFSGGQRVAMKQANGTIDYFHPDHLGSTSVLTNASGVSEQELAYHPYGETRVNTGGSSATVEEWKLEVGTFAGGNDLYQSSGLGQQTSATVSSLPTDGSQVYVTLSYKIAGQWEHDDYVYTASGSGGSGSHQLLDQNTWTLLYVDSEEMVGEDGAAVNAFDGDATTIWHTKYSGNQDPLSHDLAIDLGASYQLSGITYLPRQDGGVNGGIGQYEVYVSNAGTPPTTPLVLGEWTLVASGTFPNDATEQDVLFSGSTTGRYIWLRAMTEVNGGPWTSVAELNVMGTLPPPSMMLFHVDSEELVGEDGAAVNALDGNPATKWHTNYIGGQDPLPHDLAVDLGMTRQLSGITYLPRQDGGVNGRIGQYQVYVSNAGIPPTTPLVVGEWTLVASGTFPNVATKQDVLFNAPVSARYVWLRAITEVNNAGPWTSVAEFTVLETSGPTLLYVDSEEVVGEDGAAANALDGDPTTIWHTNYMGGQDPLPHDLAVDLGMTKQLSGITYLPRQDSGVNGRIGQYEVYVSNAGTPPTTPLVVGEWTLVASGTFPNVATKQDVLFNAPVSARYVWLRAITEVNNAGPWTSVAEFTVLEGTPPAHTELTASVTGSTITLTWGANTTPGVVGYKVYRGTSSGSYDSVTSVGNVLTHQATGLQPDTTYYFVVTAVDANDNEGLPSNEASAITSNGGSNASLLPENLTIHLAGMNNPEQTMPSNLHYLNWEPTASPPTTRLGGGLFSLRFGIPQLAISPSTSFVHLVSHGSASSTTISPAASSVLPGSTVTFSWSYTSGSSGGTDVAYKYTGKERDDSTDLYFYEARYYDAALGRFISADTIVPDPNNPQYLNRYTYVLNNPLRYTDPSGRCPECGAPGSDFFGPPSPFLGPSEFSSDIITLDTIHVTDTRISPTSNPYSDPFSFNDGTGNNPFVDTTFSFTDFFDDFFSPSDFFDDFFSPSQNIFEFFFGPEAVGKPGPSISERVIDTGTLFLSGVSAPLLKVGPKLFSVSTKEALTRGRAAEARVLKELGLTKNTQKVGTAEGNAIPDALTSTKSIEIKDRICVSCTKQIRIQTDAARVYGRESVLITGTKSDVPGSTKKAFDTIIRRDDLGPQ